MTYCHSVFFFFFFFFFYCVFKLNDPSPWLSCTRFSNHLPIIKGSRVQTRLILIFPSPLKRRYTDMQNCVVDFSITDYRVVSFIKMKPVIYDWNTLSVQSFDLFLSSCSSDEVQYVPVHFLYLHHWYHLRFSEVSIIELSSVSSLSLMGTGNSIFLTYVFTL